MADFVAVINRAVEGLAVNTPDMRSKVYAKARGAALRQLENMRPRLSKEIVLRQMDKLEAAIDSVETAFAHVVLPEDLEQAPIVPRQQPGMYFGIKTSGLVGITSSSTATDDDLLEIGGMRRVLIESVDDLLSLTAGSNAYVQIERIAKRYNSALSDENGDLLVDLLYAQGVRLENAALQLRRGIRTGNQPDMDRDVAEALDSVNSRLHTHKYNGRQFTPS